MPVMGMDGWSMLEAGTPLGAGHWLSQRVHLSSYLSV